MAYTKTKNEKRGTGIHKSALRFYVAILLFVSVFSAMRAFGAATQPPGVGSGAIGVDAGNNNISVGTPTTAANTRLLIVSSSTAGTYGLRVTQPAGGNLFTVGSDGSVVAAGSFTGTAFNGSVSAANVAADVFGRLQGNGNFAFPASLGVNTNSQVGLPQALSVYGGGYFSGSVGVGTTPGSNRLAILGDGTNPALLIDTGGGGGAANLSVKYGGSNEIVSIGSWSVGGLQFYSTCCGFTDPTNGGVQIYPRSGNLIARGNVGIGTTAPNELLEIANTSGNNARFIASDGAGANRRALLFVSPSAGVDYARIEAYGYGASGGGKPLVFNNIGGGNVGIGTTIPSQKLEVAGNVSSTGLCLGGTCQTNWSGVGSQWTAGAGGAIYYNGGNVGIGAAVPASPLSITSANAQFALFKAGSSGLASYMGFDTSGNTTGYLGQECTTGQCIVAGSGANDMVMMTTGSGPSLRFATNGIIRETILGNGNVGIGTANPQSRLTLAGGGNVNPNVGAEVDYGGQNLTFRGENAAGNFNLGGIKMVQPTGYYVDAADMVFSTANGGGTLTEKVRITKTGTVVVGGGSGKITAGTYDPLYTINGTKYATYLPGMTGQKEETTGVISKWQMANGKWQSVIDFNAVPEGSDLWLFSKVTNLSAKSGSASGGKNNFDTLAVLLTPNFDGKVWYEKDAANNRITIFAEPDTSNQQPATSFEVSYRLTAPRFDAASWSNYSTDGGTGLIINE